MTQEASPNNKVNILLVDDRPDKLLALRTALEELNENLIVANSGTDALRLLLKHDFAAIVLDVHMPIMDGFETAALIRNRPSSEHTPIIFVTSVNTTETHVSRGYSLGAVDYIFAPLDPVVLRSKLAVFIELFRKTQKIKWQEEQLRRAAEDRATNLQLRLETLLNQLDVGVFRCTAEGKLIESNRAFSRILGESTSIACRQFLKSIASTSTQSSEHQKVRVDHAIRGAIWCGFSCALTHERCIDGTVEDITARTEAEEALKGASQQKDEFLAMLGHELRNPLNAICSALSIAKRRSATEETKAWCEEVIDRQIKQLVHLLDDLLDVSRITQGKIELCWQKIEIATVIKSALTATGDLLQKKGHELIVELGSAPLWVNGDATRLEQIFVNLITNAAKYTSDRGRIVIKAVAQEREVRVSIIDTGEGISPELLPNIFELFMQASRTLDRSQGGLGIGLTLVRRLTELHHGKVEARSAGVDKGSEFTVTLPLIEQPSTQPEFAEEKSALPMLSGIKILVVDDHLDTLQATSLLLDAMGALAITCADGLSAVKIATEEKPDVVLLDLGLPGLDGYGVAKILRGDQNLSKTTLIAVSGYGQNSDRVKAFEAGFDHHMVKPLDFGALGKLFKTSILSI